MLFTPAGRISGVCSTGQAAAQARAQLPKLCPGHSSGRAPAPPRAPPRTPPALCRPPALPPAAPPGRQGRRCPPAAAQRRRGRRSRLCCPPPALTAGQPAPGRQAPAGGKGGEVWQEAGRAHAISLDCIVTELKQCDASHSGAEDAGHAPPCAVPRPARTCNPRQSGNPPAHLLHQQRRLPQEARPAEVHQHVQIEAVDCRQLPRACGEERKGGASAAQGGRRGEALRHGKPRCRRCAPDGCLEPCEVRAPHPPNRLHATHEPKQPSHRLPTCIVPSVQRRRHRGQHQRSRPHRLQVASRQLQDGLHPICTHVEQGQGENTWAGTRVKHLGSTRQETGPGRGVLGVPRGRAAGRPPPSGQVDRGRGQVRGRRRCKAPGGTRPPPLRSKQSICSSGTCSRDARPSPFPLPLTPLLSLTRWHRHQQRVLLYRPHRHICARRAARRRPHRLQHSCLEVRMQGLGLLRLLLRLLRRHQAAAAGQARQRQRVQRVLAGGVEQVGAAGAAVPQLQGGTEGGVAAAMTGRQAVR